MTRIAWQRSRHPRRWGREKARQEEERRRALELDNDSRALKNNSDEVELDNKVKKYLKQHAEEVFDCLQRFLAEKDPTQQQLLYAKYTTQYEEFPEVVAKFYRARAELA